MGGWIGAWRPLPTAVTAGLLAFASGSLITAVSFVFFADRVPSARTSGSKNRRVSLSRYAGERAVQA